MKNIYIDFDDVLCETANAIIELVEKEFGIKRQFENISDFNLQKSFGLSDTQFKQLLDFAHDPDVVYNMQPIEGAVEAIKKLKGMGYGISIMTGRPPSTREDSIKWLKDYQVPYDSLTFVDKYSRFISGLDKDVAITLDQLQELEFAFAIEDSGHMALCLANQMNVPVFLHDRPWNRFIEEHEELKSDKIHRCSDWKEILNKLQSL